MNCVCMLYVPSFEVSDDEDFEINPIASPSVNESSVSHSPLSSPPSSVSSSMVNFEGKDNIQHPAFLDQLVATTVVSAFVSNSVSQRSCVPGVMINGRDYIVCIYDCKKDLILLSDPIQYSLVNGDLYRSGILALWIVVHYQSLLLRTLDDDKDYQSSILAKLNSSGKLEDFQNLNSTNVDVRHIRMYNIDMRSSSSRFCSTSRSSKRSGDIQYESLSKKPREEPQ